MAKGFLARRRWWVGLPAAVIGVGVAAFVYQLPSTYKSWATVEITDQMVSQSYGTADTSPLDAQVDDFIRRVKAPGTLNRIARELNLYPANPPLPPAEVTERMTKDLVLNKIETAPGSVQGVEITYVSTNPLLAQAGAARVASFFIEENKKLQGTQLESNSDFLSDEVANKAAQLAEQDRRLQDFKRTYSGELPEQQLANITTLTDTRSRLQAATFSLSRAKETRASLETTVREKLVRLQAERTTLLGKYTSRHELVQKKESEIAGVNVLVQLLAGGSVSPQGVLAMDSDPSLPAIRQQIESNQQTIRELTDEEARLRTQVDEQQRRISLSPLRDQQLSNLTRDHAIIKQDYEEVRKNQLKSERSSKLVSRPDGQRFRLTEPASLPETPDGPKRRLFSLGGLGGGILLGILIALMIELRDKTFHKEGALRQAYSKVPLVLAIPTLYSQRERTKHTVWKVMEWVAALALLSLVAMAELYVYRQG